MVKKIFSLLALIIITILPSWSDPLEVVFLDGEVAWFEDNHWQPELEIGDQISEEALLRLEDGAVVELSYKQNNLTLYSAGSYQIRQLLNRQEEVADWDLSAILSQKMASLFNEDHMSEMGIAVLGVRQAKFNNRFDEVEWIVEEDIDPLAEAINLINTGKYKKAITLLANLSGKMDRELEQDHLYYSALAQLKGGSKGKAISLLTKVKNNPAAPYYSDLILLKGKILLESLAYAEALELLDLYLEHMPGGENGQEVNFMAGICNNALGDTKTALRHFEAARQMDQGSLVGRAAGDWLKKISGS